MANPNAPHGFAPVQNGDGSPYTGKGNLYHIPSTDTLAYFLGDVVGSAATGADANGVPDVIRQANGTNSAAYNARGVIVGIMVAPIGTGAGNVQGGNVDLNVQTIPATKTHDYYVLVADDPGLVMEIQADNSGAFSASSINLNARFIQGTPVAGDLVSRTVLDSATVATTATFPLKIVGLPYRPNVDFTANTPLHVRFNTHELSVGGTAGV